MNHTNLRDFVICDISKQTVLITSQCFLGERDLRVNCGEVAGWRTSYVKINGSSERDSSVKEGRVRSLILTVFLV